MTLALPKVASRIMGGSLFFANKRESSSHISPFCYKYYDIIFTGEKPLTNFYNVICIKIICLFNLVENGFFGIAFVDAITHAVAFSVAPEKVFRW
jgi:hypothetical protein